MADPVKGPAVFNYQPTRFERVLPENLADWERRMRDYVGIQGQILLDQEQVGTDTYDGPTGPPGD